VQDFLTAFYTTDSVMWVEEREQTRLKGLLGKQVRDSALS
jgi:hypothetical protein